MSIVKKEKKFMRLRVCFVVAILANAVSLYPESAVTYLMSDGRFGDQLLAYCHAKWISYRYALPLLYQPFKYSDQLVMHYVEKRYSAKDFNFSDRVLFNEPSSIDSKSDILYLIPFFPESPLEICLEPFDRYYFAVDWKDPVFKAKLRKLIYPVDGEIPRIKLSSAYVNVAMHIRKGTNFDIILGTDVKDLSDRNKGPLLFKIPPDSFYIDQLKRIADIYSPKPLYVYIFTDHDNPAEIAERYQSCLSEYRITFDYRKEGNSHDANVLEDFFCMAFSPFDCLIRPESHYSFVASKLGDYTMVFSPKNYFFEGDRAIIDEVTIEMNA